MLEPCRLGLDFTLMAGEGGAGVWAGLCNDKRPGLDFTLMAGDGGAGAGGGWGHNNSNVMTSGQVCQPSFHVTQCNVLCAPAGAGGGSGRTDLVLDASALRLNLSPDVLELATGLASSVVQPLMQVHQKRYHLVPHGACGIWWCYCACACD